MALIMICVERKERIIIVAPSEKQANIIMSYVIQHIFDHPYLVQMIVYEGSLERLKQERSKKRITFRSGSEIMIITSDVTTVSKQAKAIMGFGATIVVADESSLIPDMMFSKILRMVGGTEGKLVKLGNPFERNHFFRSFFSDLYYQVIIRWQQAVSEGRITREFVEEARGEMPPMDFTVFYDCDFPEGGAEDALIPYDWIQLAVNQSGIGGDWSQVGLDVARYGRDKTIYTHRVGGKVMYIAEKQHADTMTVAGWAAQLLDKDKPETCAIDVVGIGAGVYDRLEELKYKVSPVNVGEAPSNDKMKEKFYNLRAEIHWNLREQFRPEGTKSKISIPDDKDLIFQLSEIRYRYSSEKKIRIEAKEDMKARLGASPDKADSLGLAFAQVRPKEPQLWIG